MTVTVTPETTRNEHSVIFQLNKTLRPPGTGLSFPNAPSAQNHELARALFQIKGVASIWIIGSEVQVTKSEGVGWGAIKGKIVETIRQVES
ncbi:MAG: hypothetical protein GWM98_07185 [Nitrospinaceae bacterium]|nr:hypothetical protein [Nitrospinaceae bacterium]NIR54320.1 hypothetical protein [Nitrospinaceae bacterium]NIS84738.1 hypothetical protein [Nitrospinaceae bacterium]NIT81539.1 hypothetical protein [Nitrospinaceae bacterium]NIU43824.1 hypothetical protein [Nitrospinaceae bacterium]